MSQAEYECALCKESPVIKGLNAFNKHMVEVHGVEGPWVMKVDGVDMLITRSGLVPYEKP